MKLTCPGGGIACHPPCFAADVENCFASLLAAMMFRPRTVILNLSSQNIPYKLTIRATAEIKYGVCIRITRDGMKSEAENDRVYLIQNKFG